MNLIKRVPRKAQHNFETNIKIDRKGEFAQVTFSFLPALGRECYWVRGTIKEVADELESWIQACLEDYDDYSENQNECAKDKNYYGADFWEDEQRKLDQELYLVETALNNINKLIKLGNVRKRVA